MSEESFIVQSFRCLFKPQKENVLIIFHHAGPAESGRFCIPLSDIKTKSPDEIAKSLKWQPRKDEGFFGEETREGIRCREIAETLCKDGIFHDAYKEDRLNNDFEDFWVARALELGKQGKLEIVSEWDLNPAPFGPDKIFKHIEIPHY